MKTMYKGVFKNSFLEEEIEIKNDFETLSFCIGLLKFEGVTIDDFELLNFEKYTTKQLQNFSFNKVISGDSFIYEVCDYQLVFLIPISLIHFKSNKTLPTELKITSLCGKASKSGGLDTYELTLELNINGKYYTGFGDLFEIAAENLLKKLKSEYVFKNCFGCNFSDYSPFGTSTFGSMMCFKNQKEKYLKVKTKAEYFNLDVCYSHVQETFYCNEFEIRKKNIGYRG
ncbi:DUF6304 family protein [uncultured Tenacibaculum sp.]|uniref:DUF6304 family protein n=1 Tax=uncultured Tenacibaculum sp. TaxID=174713 RepID=UPI002611FF60|nr:DUF6304 family protein [uncultured Tenacibaculum sp.]